MEEKNERDRMISPAFSAFFQTLLDAPIDTKRCLDSACRAFEYLAKDIPLGKAEIKISASANRMLPNGERRRKTLYHKGETEKKPELHVEFETEIGGETSLDFYAPKGYAYTDLEKEELEFAAKQLYVFIGRARLGMLFDRAISEDGLTGIPNLTTFYAHGSRLISMGKLSRYDAFYFNVRNFKYINRMVDYQGGDGVMIQYAHQVCDFLIEDEMVARLGGDNYVALIRRDRTKAFLQYLRDIVVDVETSSGKKQMNLSAVCGIYEIEDGVVKMSDVMTAISTAIQAAKQVYQKEYVYYTPELSQQILYEKKVAQEFVENMADGKFITYLQPKMDLKDNSICGAEALARWKYHGKVIDPEWFIPMLEKDGAVCMLDFEILRQVCALIANWQKLGRKPVRISVNLSSWNLHSKTLVHDIMDILNEYQVDPQYIEIELTETMDYREYADMAEIFKELKENGLTTSIDNFGLGFSSLNMIKDLDIDVLKLDRQVIAELDGEEGFKNQVMVENIIDMAKKMNMKVLAEGVETAKQRDFLIRAKCDVAQGFLYAMPMRIEEFERRIYR